MAGRNSVNNSPATPEAIERLCARHLHQCFWVPANEALGHGRLRVTYATTSNFEDESLPAVLFCHPMFGGRGVAATIDALAREKGVRVIVPDRPGMGGSSQVPLAIRMATWLEIVPLLLKHLRVDHVHLVAHSAGTTYLLNTLLGQRGGVLGREETYVGIMAPWVHSEHSRVALTNWAAKLPNGMLDGWNGLVRTINQRIAPSLSWSGGAISSVAGMFGSGSKEEGTNENDLAKLYGTSPEVAREMERLQGKFFFAEDTTAGNEDARLCLKMGGTRLWGACEDYPDFVRTLAAGEQERKNADAGSPGLKTRVFYAESDMLIGKGGQKYFEECWSQDGVPGPIDYEGKELPGTDHDSVSIGNKSALPTIFTDIANLSQSNPTNRPGTASQAPTA